MPEERGSIYKSTANEIGEALKAKLGGEGFAPKDWSENLNLLGIASEDTEAAINSLKESEGSGERGSILLSTANAIGSMLNKKYNSQRGFSPAEWASAISKMKALETDTKSGGIVNLKGAKEVPITSLAGTVNPTLEGVDSLTATRLGENLVEGAVFFTATNYVVPPRFWKSGTYTVSCKRTTNINGIYVRKGNTLDISGEAIAQKFNTLTLTFTISEDGYYIIQFYRSTSSPTWEEEPITEVKVEVGSEATDYTPYVEPTTYTANLGRTIYGGSADVVKGEGVDENGDTFTFDPIPINTSGDTENFYTSNGDTSITYYEEPTPYTRGSASGMIASIPEANTEFPFTKLKATIAPSVEGVSSVVVKNEGKNLLPNKTYQRNANTLRIGTDTLDGRLSLQAGTYMLSITSDVEIGTMTYTIAGTSTNITFTSSGTRYYGSFTLSANTDDIFLHVYKSGGITAENVSDFMLEVGSSSTEYTAYKNPTTYTAELGETVFGGSVDFVSGEVIDSNDVTFYIEPQEIYPNEGVNNIWNDANGITEVGYFGE